MSKPLKILAAVGIVLLLLGAALAILARLLITPERIKGVILPKAESALNRPVSLESIEISLFSGITLNQLVVQEKTGNEPFIAAEKVVLRYRLWPLLFKRVVIDEIRLVTPRIRIERQADGRFNFSDLLEEGKKEQAEPTKEERSEPVDLLVSRVELSNGRLLFIDHRSGAATPFRQEVNELNVSAREISLGKEFPFNFGARVNEGMLKGEGAVNLQTQAGRIVFTIADLDLAPFAPYYREKIPAQINALRLNLKVEAEGGREALKSRGEVTFAPVDLSLPRKDKGPLTIRNAVLNLDYAIAADLKTAILEIEKATLAFNGIPLEIAGRVEDYAAAPKVNLRLTLPELIVEETIKRLPPEPLASLAELQPAGKLSGYFQLVGTVSEPKKLLREGELQLASVSVLLNGVRPNLIGTLKIAGDSLRSENLQVQLGENRAAIDLQMENLLGEIIRVRSNVRAERFALDPLLQGSAAPVAATASPAQKKETFPLVLPVEAEGSVAIGETVYKGLSIRDFDLRYRLQKNVLTVERLNGKVANGTFAVTGNTDLGRKLPPSSVRLNLQGIEADPLLRAFYPKMAGTVFGALNFQGTAHGEGMDAKALKRNLSAEAKGVLTNGRITGTELLQGLADFLKLEELRELRFSRSEGSFIVRQGKLTIDSNIVGKNLRLHPQGTVNLDGFALDLALNLQLAPELVGRMGQGRVTSFLADEQGWSQIPVKVGGTFSSPRFTFDTAALRGKVREKAGEEIRRKLRKELDKRFPSGNGKPEEENGRPAAEDVLRELFGR
jgi:AsmA protein